MPLQVTAMLPISRGIPASGSRGMVRAGKGRRKRVCRRNRKLLDKKSRSLKRTSRERTTVLQTIKAWIPGKMMPDSVNRTMLQIPCEKADVPEHFWTKSPKVRCKAGAGGKPGFYKGKQHVYRAGQFQSAGGNREETAGCGRLSPEGHLQAVAEKGKIP